MMAAFAYIYIYVLQERERSTCPPQVTVLLPGAARLLLVVP